jgi:RNA polymerase sigma factor (sigma-70 family)
MNALLAHLRRHRPPEPAAADGELLARYAAAGDESAFTELVLRHGPVVYAACRRLLPDPADAEDAFQAVWLVLVRRAGKLSGRATVGPWLYQVAVWTARNLRRRNAHRLARRSPLSESVPDPSPDTAALRLDLDAALLALPEKYRAPVVLCHLHGWSRREAAVHLGCPEGTLSAILARALAKLRRHLAGADPSILLAAAGVALPAGLAEAAVRAASAFRTASLSAAGVSPAVADLTRGALRMFWVKKAAAAGLVLATVLGTGLGIGFGTGPRAVAQPAPKAAPPAKDPPTADELAARIKQLEDEIARLKEQADVLREQKELRDLTEKLARLRNAGDQEPRLEVAVRAGDAGADDLSVTEYGRGGQRVGSVRCSNVEMLKRFLARTHKDPAGPKKLTVTAAVDFPFDKLAAVLNAIKAAGFEQVEMRTDKTPPADPPGYVIEPPDILTIDVSVRGKPAGGDRLDLPLEPIRGEHLVRPDGTVSLGAYGPVSVSGLTIDQAAEAIRKHLAGHELLREKGFKADDLVVAVDVKEYNSKSCYVITDLTGDGEQVVRLPVTGKETVRDAVAKVGGLGAKAAAGRVYVARPAPAGGQDQILPVDWAGITRHGQSETNYQLLPGDRVYVREK